MDNSMLVDLYASQPQYAAHAGPVWTALPDEVRGDAYGFAGRTTGKQPTGRWDRARPVIVAGYSDAVRARPRPVIYVEHGSGQSYDGDRWSRGHSSYSGGSDLENVILFVSPNETVAARWRAQYPQADVVVAGCPKLDRFSGLNAGIDIADAGLRGPLAVEQRQPCVAITFHWDCSLIPETRSAWPHYDEALPEFVTTARDLGWAVLGHGHPRAWSSIAQRWTELGVEAVEDFDEVLCRADVLCADNTSAMWEFAAVGKPIVVMDAPWYRRDVEHGLRFWRHADAGLRVTEPGRLVDAVFDTLDDPNVRAAERTAAVAEVYSRLDGKASDRAAAAIMWTLTEGSDRWETPRRRGGRGRQASLRAR